MSNQQFKCELKFPFHLDIKQNKLEIKKTHISLNTQIPILLMVQSIHKEIKQQI